MLELPEWAVPNGATPTFLDYGITLRPSSGAGALRVERPGSRFAVEVSLPAMPPDKARVVISRLLRAKNEGMRIAYPLLKATQGAPGAPVVDGASPSGTTLPLRGLTPNYTVKEGYWLTLIDAAGQRYLHNAAETAAANADGDLSLTIHPAIRGNFADGATVLLGKPEVEGLVTSEVSWGLPLERLVRISFTIEESA